MVGMQLIDKMRELLANLPVILASDDGELPE
jgi:hypothetical protein